MHPRAFIRAFTLVEVLVVVAVIAIAGAIVVPSITQTGSMGVQAAGRMVIADMLFAQNDAIAKQKSRKVVYDAAANSYKLTALDGTVLGVNWKSGEASTGNYIIDFKNDDRFRGVKIEDPSFGNDSELVFDALGAPDSGGSVDVVFGTFRYRVTVTPMTGRVTIAPVNGG
jgi:prepilin-type N-terminal cleavage/methylation domain-containing protein